MYSINRGFIFFFNNVFCNGLDRMMRGKINGVGYVVFVIEVEMYYRGVYWVG